MKKRIKFFGYIILAILIILGLTYVYLNDFSKNDFLSKGPRNAQHEIPITYNLGWWSNQEGLVVKELVTEVIESNLNLFNSKSLISYRIKGTIKYSNHWKPFIEEVHISEALNRDSSLNFDRIIEITPIVKTKEDKSERDEIVEFEFSNEHTITSAKWGNNRILIRCQNREKLIELKQSK